MASLSWQAALAARRLPIAAAIVMALVLPLLVGAQENSAGTQASPRKRLPAFFAKVVTPQQKEQVYQIQAQYEPKINALQEQIAALERERNEAMRSLLTPQQRQQIDELAAAAEARRKERKETASRDEQAADASPTLPAKAGTGGSKPK